MSEELAPLIYLRGDPLELSNKGGRGGAKPPWVDVDESGLRNALLESLDRGQQLVSALPPAVADGVGVPIRIKLRDEARAKSNRPTSFLESSGAVPTAVGQTGELFARVTRADLQSLRSAVGSGSTKSALYAISSLDEISIFRPVEDAFGVRDVVELARILNLARDAEQLVRLDLFPWLHGETSWSGRSLVEHLSRIGLVVRAVRGTAKRESVYVAPTSNVDANSVGGLYGIRHASAEPRYSHWRDVTSQSMAIVGTLTKELREEIEGSPRQGIVGVLDSGIDAALLEPWVQSRETYDLGSDRNPEHGTFVAGLIFAGALLNDQDCFGGDAAVLVDGQVLPSVPIDEHVLLERITETIEKHPEVKVWNCSFASQFELKPLAYSVFAAELDRLSAKHGVLFIQAAGNYEDAPARTWPPPSQVLTDGIASPADAVNSLVVGSLSHRGGRTPIGSPASYSRRGPSFGGQSKPDVTYWSGDLGPSNELPHSGIRSVVPGDQIAESVGTSFATPLVSAIAANVWAELEDLAEIDTTPQLVKGLIIHGAAVNSHTMVGPHRNYFGAGVPLGDLRTLFESSATFTTVHRVDLQSKLSWLRAPFPIPPCLFTDAGTLRAEVFMTVAFAPLLDEAYGEEAVRTCIEASFGVVAREDGKITITGKVPEEKLAGPHPWESALVAAGKWSPVRTHHKKFSRGIRGDEWGLKLTLTEREDDDAGIEQPAYVFLTLKGLDDGLPVHAEGLAEIQRLALWSAPLSQRTSISVQTSN